MAELDTISSCCSAGEQETCCEPADKAACCGGGDEIREAVRQRYSAAAGAVSESGGASCGCDAGALTKDELRRKLSPT